MKKLSLSEEEIKAWGIRFRNLSNTARYDEAYRLAKAQMRKHPDVLLFAYVEAVMTAEDDTGYSQAELDRRYASAARKFRRLLFRARAMSDSLRDRARNEYYWFSKQHRKQYQLGLSRLAAGDRTATYSAGVGAERLARKYALAGKRALALRWAKKSEKMWERYFRVVPNWFNSYFFHAAALGYQGRVREMDKALARAAKIAKKPAGWAAIRQQRRQILEVLAKLEF